MKIMLMTGKVKMIFKDFTIIGPDSVSAAHGAHCASMIKESFGSIMIYLYNNWMVKIMDGHQKRIC